MDEPGRRTYAETLAAMPEAGRRRLMYGEWQPRPGAIPPGPDRGAAGSDRVRVSYATRDVPPWGPVTVMTFLDGPKAETTMRSDEFRTGPLSVPSGGGSGWVVGPGWAADPMFERPTTDTIDHEESAVRRTAEDGPRPETWRDRPGML
jgi:hypothetical protein